MFVLNEDNSIYVTRGDIVAFFVTAEDNGKPYTFKAGDLLRVKIFGKKNADSVLLQKDFPIIADTESVDIYLTKEDTKLGEVISKPKDYWYEVELNPLTDPQTIIGYDEDGAKIFKLFPEGDDIEEYEPTEEDIPFVDHDLDLSSSRPVENQVIARAIIGLTADFEETKEEITQKSDTIGKRVSQVSAEVEAERGRIDNIISGGVEDPNAELLDLRVDASGFSYNSAGTAVREQFQRISAESDSLLTSGLAFLKGGFKYGKITNTGEEYSDKYRVKSSTPIQYDRDIVITIADGFRCALHFYNNDGTYSYESGWVTGTYSITAKTLFKVVIARVAEDTTENAVISEFIQAVSVTTAISELIENAADTHRSYWLHEASDKHLKSVLLSNNFVDPALTTDGGYYSYYNGKWIERSDISTTGLIPCEKGQVYYFGIDFEHVRGGNCTFWDESGAFVSGVDVTDGAVGFVVPDNDEIKYFRISFYTNEKNKWHVNLGEYKEYDVYRSVYVFDKEVVTPSFDTSDPFDAPEAENVLRYMQTYKDDISVQHKRNNEVGTSYQVTVINKEKFDGTQTKVTVEGTSSVNPLGDKNNTNVSTYAKKNNYLHIINGGIYLVANGEADGITIINGEILKSTGVEQFDKEQYVFGITANGKMKAYINKTAENILADGCKYALTGFVPLIQDGQAVPSSVLSVCPHYNSRHPRQIIGVLTDGNYFTFCCDGRTDGENGMTLQECIDTITEDMSVEFAFNLDGGGSTQTTIGKKQINRVIDGRTIPNVIVFR